MNVTRRTVVAGGLALAAQTSLMPPFLHAKTTLPRCLVTSGLDYSSSVKKEKKVEELQALMMALQDARVAERFDYYEVSSFSVYAWANMTYTICPPTLIRRQSLEIDLLTVISAINEERKLVKGNGGGYAGTRTDTALAITTGMDLLESIPADPYAEVKAINICTDDDDSRMGISASVPAQIAKEKGITVNAMVWGKDLTFARKYIQAGTWAFVQGNNPEKDTPADMTDAWVRKLLRDMATHDTGHARA